MRCLRRPDSDNRFCLPRNVRQWVGVTITAFCVLLLFLHVAPAYADDPTFTSRRPFGTGADATTTVAVGDVDGDGALDLVVGNGDLIYGGGQNMVYLNDGSGHFYTGPVTCGVTEGVRCFGT